jgi:uncharacterized protein YecT (DUF1311 family)
MINFRIKWVFVLFMMPFFANSMSQDEQLKYFEIEGEYKNADNELNGLYKSQMKEYKQEGGEFYGQDKSRDFYLKKSQQEWIKMRDASCDYETYESRRGTGFSSIYKKCLLEKTKARIKYLKEKN